MSLHRTKALIKLENDEDICDFLKLSRSYYDKLNALYSCDRNQFNVNDDRGEHST